MRGPQTLMLAAVLAAALAPGCIFHRTVTNAAVADLDPGAIVPGETDFRGVLRILGPPNALDPRDFIIGRVHKRFMSYTYAETKSATLIFPPNQVILPGRWADQQLHRKILVEFDEHGVVTSVTDSRRQSIWPIWGEDDNTEPVLVDYRDGSAP